jgi:hypothetical protein
MPVPHLSTSIVALVAASSLALSARGASTTPDFQREIRPILSNNCFKCHGPDEKERKGGKEGSGGLRLDTEEGSRADLGDSIVVVPGHPEKSELITRITTADRDELMPPPKSGKKLKPEEIERLTAWIKAGAKFARHWSYEKPVRIEPPLSAANPIDGFIRARLEKEGLKPQAEADRTALIRRVALDLTGLPPTLEEVDAFVNDTAPDAYDRLVDRLLASPAYGEHWARMWLDLARYADSAGYADDPPRTIWAFRDYVIRSFNANKPFDEFSIEQIAGDLLPHPTEDQLTATAFHRNTMTNNEGGTQDEEFRNAAIVDRVNTTMAVWMGTSMACAQCHSHKYDPLSQTEYFRLFAFFNNTEDADRKDETPVLSFFTEEQKAQRAALEAEYAALEVKFKSPTDAALSAAQKWADDFPVKLEWKTLHAATLRSQAGLPMNVEKTTRSWCRRAAQRITTPSKFQSTPHSNLPRSAWKRFPTIRCPQKGPGHGGGNFVVTRIRATVQPPHGSSGPRARFVRIELPGKGKLLQLAEVQVFSGNENIALKGEARQKSTLADAVARRAIDGNTAGEYAKGSVAHSADGDDPWWEVDLMAEQTIDRIIVWNRAELGERLAGFRVAALNEQRQPVWEKAGNAAAPADMAFELNGGREINFSDAVADFVQTDFEEDFVVSDAAPKELKRGKKKAGAQKGWAIGGSTGAPHILSLLAAAPVEIPAGAKLAIIIEQQSSFANHTLGHFRLGITGDTRATEYLQTPKEIIAALAVPAGQRDPKQREQLIDYYMRNVGPEFKADREKLLTLRKQIDAIAPSTVPVFRELAANQRRKTRVQLRGNYRSLADEVSEGVPAAFHPLPPDAPLNRLTLARWLMDEKNPLTARVVANRFWESIFGIGLVRTSEEFGAQGEPPSHPELLDWLATELVRGKWDIKKFLKLLISSATYRQSSKVTPDLVERDPDNRLLARGPRFRMSAEMVRDQALVISGLYSRTMFGPSVRPVRPALGLAAAFGGGLDWQASAGDDRHRRALYTEWRRTSPYPSMVTFDAPNREVCTLRRNRTNTPLQALVTMNDPVYVEAAQGLARRMIEGAATPDEQVTRAFRMVLARSPSETELHRCIALHDEALAAYKHDAKKAVEMATNPIGAAPQGSDVAELAAWTTVAGVLLNLDETLMKR